jgi:16S rRNA (cytidine1402-2'-O)-methyltransferase
MGTLFLVATPIGNLEDITLRALRVLSEVGLIAAEDTRQTIKLLDRHSIRARLISYHEHNKISRLDEVLAALAIGDVALVSDAGTPGLNDPGYELVRAALKAGYPVSPIPGPSAPVTALVASGLPTDTFLFLGYLPRRGGERRRLLESVRKLTYTLVFLETPHRLVESLADIIRILGDRPAASARELTKLHEEILRLPLSGLSDHFQLVAPRGDFTLVVQGARDDIETWDEERIDQALLEGIARGAAAGELAEQVASLSGWRKNQVYRRFVSIKPPNLLQ